MSSNKILMFSRLRFLWLGHRFYKDSGPREAAKRTSSKEFREFVDINISREYSPCIMWVTTSY